MRIILARHADATNQDGVFHGLKDTDLTAYGEREAEDLADELLEYKPALIITSKMKRSIKTGRILSELLGIPMRIDPSLNPLNLGDFVGKDIDEYLPDVKHFLNNPSETIPGGESVNDWAKKYLPFFDRFHKIKSDETIIFVTHGRNILLTKAHLKAGKGFDKHMLAEGDTSTEHGGIAIADDKGFRILDKKGVKPGQS